LIGDVHETRTVTHTERASRGEAPLSILQVSTADLGGGAERVAWNLFETLRRRGHRSELAVGFRRGAGADAGVRWLAPRGGGPWSRGWNGVAALATRALPAARATPRAVRLARRMATPRAWLEAWRGHEDFEHPATWTLLDPAAAPPDVLHLHNLHGGYFDLRALPALSACAPTLVTLHDSWMRTGHCAYTLGCPRWETGCGACPHLDTFPPIRVDATAENWERKQAIYRQCRLHVATPSRWLLDQVERSMLAPAVAEARVIPNGVDLTIFAPAEHPPAPREAGLDDEDPLVLAFVANRFRSPRSWKDWPTVRDAVARASERLARPVHLIAVGDATDPDERVGRAVVRALPDASPPEVARELQRAHLALHAARPEAETYPNVVLEALACGTPVVATAVGGIPEQIAALALPGLAGGAGPDRATGVLVPPGDAEAMARAIEALARHPETRARLADNAVRDARARHGLERQVDAYLAWYRELAARPAARPSTR